MRTFLKCFDFVVEALGFVSALLLGVVAVGITAEILVRGFNLGSLPWMIEIVEYSLLVVTFFGAPWVLKHSAHVRVDIVVESLSPRYQRLAELAANLIGIAVCAVIFYYGLLLTIDLHGRDTKIYKIMTVKEWWLFALVPVSCAVMFVEFIRRIARRDPASHTDASDTSGSGL